MTSTEINSVEIEPSSVKIIMTATGLSLGLAVLFAFVGLVFHALSLTLASVTFGIGSVTLYSVWSLIRRGVRQPSRESRWLIPVAGWALSAPLSAVIWKVLPSGADSTTDDSAFELVPHIWLWALIPAVIYTLIVVRSRGKI